MENIIVISKRDKCPEGYELIDATSRNADPILRSVSPFYLGPVECYDGLTAKNMENAWQYSKVYPEDIDEEGHPTASYFKWRDYGFNRTFADRYPKGKGAIPCYSYWKTQKGYEHLGYIDARKKIYIPLYATAVYSTPGFKRITEMMEDGRKIALADFDGYDNIKLGMSIQDVVNCETKKMGHAFIIKMLLDGILEDIV